MQLTPAGEGTWAIAALATLGVMVRPWGLPEAVWAVAGALLLLACSLLTPAEAWSAVAGGGNVYLFLTGMMLLAELARREGLFDWLAALAAGHARGSPRRLFALLYIVGVVVTVLLSNDATAVVLTPAVYAVTRAVQAAPLPYLLICAFIANAASFALPISNPANLVVFGNHLPPLAGWLARFAVPSMIAILVTYLLLRFTQRGALRGSIMRQVAVPALSAGGRLTGAGIVLTAAALLGASAAGVPLGAPTCIAAALTGAAVLLFKRETPWAVLRGVSWGVLPLVAGLFVLVQGLAHTGVLDSLRHALQAAAMHSAGGAALAAGIAAALACNVANNLPIALLAGGALSGAGVGAPLAGAVLIGVDLGPNLSVTGSLATLLWLVALRREGQHIRAGSFLWLGVRIMPPALLLSLCAAVWLTRG